MLALGSGEHGTEMQRPLDGVLARLVSADALGLVDVADALHRSEDVEELADVEFDAQLVPDAHGFGRCTLHQPIGVHERQVADEDCHTFAVAARLAHPTVGGVLFGRKGVRGHLTATGDGVVHHVVVEQRECVHQLERRTGIDVDLVVGAAAGADVAPVSERRAQALAAGQHQAPDLVDRLGEVGIEGDPTLAFGGQQFVEAGLDAVSDRSQAGWGGSRHLQEGYCCVRRPAPTCIGVARIVAALRVRVGTWVH